MKFYNAFMEYFEKSGKKSNTKGVNIKHIKTFMNYAYKKEWTKKRITDFPDFKKIQVDTESVYLSVDELEKIYNYKFDRGFFEKESKALDNARDLFLMGCWL